MSRNINTSICTLKFITPLYHPFVNPRVFFAYFLDAVDKLSGYSVYIPQVENGRQCADHSHGEGGGHVPPDCL